MRIILFTLFLSGSFVPPLAAMKGDSICIFFWNVENLFHPDHDSLREDLEFTPGGDRHWSFYRYYSKISRTWKVIMSFDPVPPAIIGLAEVENEQVMKDLWKYSPFGKLAYRFIHQESDDRRGIDVALAYDPSRVELLDSCLIKVDLSVMGGGKTRDILYAKFGFGNDSLHLFVNHWPSKYGGAGYSEPYRMKAAAILLREIDNLREKEAEARIVCMGDFNDSRDSRSMQLLVNNNELTILQLEAEDAPGTVKYQGKWEFIDHMVISSGWFSNRGEIRTGRAGVYSPAFLLEKDEKYGGMKPYRTWNGYSFREGFSDHLPVFLWIIRD